MIYVIFFRQLHCVRLRCSSHVLVGFVEVVESLGTNGAVQDTQNVSANHAKESEHELKSNPDICRGHGPRLLLKSCPALLSHSVP